MCSSVRIWNQKVLHALEAIRVESTVISLSCDSLLKRGLPGWTKVYVPLVLLYFDSL